MFSPNQIKRYLTLAKNACLYSDCKKARLGCILVYKNKIISVGWNSQDKTNPVQKEYNKLRGYDPYATNDRSTLHAEMTAMLKCRRMDIDWSKVTMFVFRIKRDGSQGMARPCPACMGYALRLGIEQFYYSTDYGYGYENATVSSEFVKSYSVTIGDKIKVCSASYDDCVSHWVYVTDIKKFQAYPDAPIRKEFVTTPYVGAPETSYVFNLDDMVEIRRCTLH